MASIGSIKSYAANITHVLFNMPLVIALLLVVVDITIYAYLYCYRLVRKLRGFV
jgi:hypothetical protein